MHYNSKCLIDLAPAQVELALRVHGVARVPSNTSVHGTVVRIITTAGALTAVDP